MQGRRWFLASLAALTLPRVSWADVGSPAFLAAARTAGGHGLCGLSANGETLFTIPLPGRGHAAAAHPVQPLAVAFARRPGTFALVLDCLTGTVSHRLTPPEGRQFNGHGAFSADGSVLYTSEVVAETSEGRIGLWAVAGFDRLGEWASGGIGPHDVKRLADGSLLVANGGIVTDPTDRTKLNLGQMRPNLAHLSAEGQILDVARLPDELFQNSTRHLALCPDGQVAVALQWEGDLAETVPLLALWQPGRPMVACPAPEGDLARMKGYGGSVAVAEGGEIAITSSHGGVVMLHAPGGAFAALHVRGDISGVAARPGGGFVTTDGQGAIWTLDGTGLTLLSQADRAWDNHLVRLA